MRTILVTGADGFIGQNLIRAFSSCDFEVIAIDKKHGDISLKDTWDRLPSSDVLVHLAGKSNVPASWEAPSVFIQTNCLGTSYALEYCRKHRAKLIFLSSYMYGDAGSEPITETVATLSKNPYALTKQFSEQLCEIYNHNFNLDVRILRPFNVFGPGQNKTFLIPKIIFEALTSGKVQVKDLEPRRDYIYVDDITAAIIKLIDYSGSSRIFNIGTGYSHSVMDVIKAVQDILGKKIDVINDNERRPGEIMDSVANIELARREIGWVPKYTFRQGLSQMIERL